MRHYTWLVQYMCFKTTVLCCAALASEVLGKALPKDPELRLGDWETLPLSPQQQSYAAADAYASLRICQVCHLVCLVLDVSYMHISF